MANFDKNSREFKELKRKLEGGAVRPIWNIIKLYYLGQFSISFGE